MKNTKADGKKQSDYLKWGLVVVLLIIATVANVHYEYVSPSLRLVAWIFGAIVLLAIAAWTSQGHKSWKYLKASRNEIKKVVWPSRQTTLQVTLIVALMVIVIALIVFVFDQILLLLIGWVLPS